MPNLHALEMHIIHRGSKTTSFLHDTLFADRTARGMKKMNRKCSEHNGRPTAFNPYIDPEPSKSNSPLPTQYDRQSHQELGFLLLLQ